MTEDVDTQVMAEMGGRRDRGLWRQVIASIRFLVLLFAPILIGVAVWFGGWLALLAWLGTVFILIDTTMLVIDAMLGERPPRWQAFLYWLGSIYWGGGGIWFVKRGGEIIPVRPIEPMAGIFFRLGAPSIIVLQADVAVVLERSGTYTRVETGRIVFARRFERIAHVIDLRPQRREKALSQVITRDGLAFDVENLEVEFQVESRLDVEHGRRVISRDRILAFVCRGGMLVDEEGKPVEWGRRVLQLAELSLRNVAARHPLEELISLEDGSARQRFLEETTEELRLTLAQYGVELLRVALGKVVLPKEVREALTLSLKRRADEAWAEVQHRALVEVGRGLNDAIQVVTQNLQPNVGPAAAAIAMSLQEILGRVLQNYLQLAPPYREGGGLPPRPPEAR